MDGFPSGSKAGSDRRFVRKVERTFVTVALTVPPVSIVLLVLPCLFCLQELANADNKCVRSGGVNIVSHSSWMPMSRRNLFHLSKHPVCCDLVALAIPAF